MTFDERAVADISWQRLSNAVMARVGPQARGVLESDGPP
jgi:hypothetical protein